MTSCGVFPTSCGIFPSGDFRPCSLRKATTTVLEYVQWWALNSVKRVPVEYCATEEWIFVLRWRSEDLVFVNVVVICPGARVCWDESCRSDCHGPLGYEQFYTLKSDGVPRMASPSSWVLQWSCCVGRSRLPWILLHVDWLSLGCPCPVDADPNGATIFRNRSDEGEVSCLLCLLRTIL